MALSFRTTPPPRALGLILLTTDEVLEPEFRAAAPAGAVFHHSRVESLDEVTTDALATMAARLGPAAARLPLAADYAAIAYACTSGATVIGPARVAETVRAVHPGAAVTDPLSAAVAALRAVGARRIGLLTPYVADVSAALRGALAAAGIETAAFGSFEQVDDRVVARIDEASTLEALVGIGRAPGVDAVFASCTNLRTFGVIEAAEAALGRPVISSNAALLWRLLAHAGLPAAGPGRLFRAPAPAGG